MLVKNEDILKAIKVLDDLPVPQENREVDLNDVSPDDWRKLRTLREDAEIMEMDNKNRRV